MPAKRTLATTDARARRLIEPRLPQPPGGSGLIARARMQKMARPENSYRLNSRITLAFLLATGEVMSRFQTAVLTTTVLTSLAFSLHAQDEPAPMPTVTAKGGSITDTINGDTGAIFDLGGGVTFTFPVGLPVGRSRLVTMKKASAIPGKIVHAKWKALGPAVEFTGAFNTTKKPMVFAVANKSNPIKGGGMKLVIAVEVGSFCDGPNKAYKLKGGLCSGFELHDAEYDEAGKRMVANLRSTGGLRLQFGLVPASD